MTTFTEHTTLADIVTAQPALARELETRGLDYCCGGAATLADSCRSNDLDVDTVLAELAAVDVDEATPWATMSVAELVDHLEVTHHQYLWAELPRLSTLADKVVSVHAERHPELLEIAACYSTLRADLEPHLTKDEHVLFPMARHKENNMLFATVVALEQQVAS